MTITTTLESFGRERLLGLSTNFDPVFTLSLLLFLLLLLFSLTALFRLRFIAYDPLHPFLLPFLHLLPFLSIFVALYRSLWPPLLSAPLSKYLSFYLPQFFSYLCVSSLLHSWIKIYSSIKGNEKGIERVSKGISYVMLVIAGAMMTMREGVSEEQYVWTLVIGVALQALIMLSFAIHPLLSRPLSPLPLDPLVLLSATKRSLLLSFFYLFSRLYSLCASSAGQWSDEEEWRGWEGMEVVELSLYLYTLQTFLEFGALLFPSNPKDLTPSWLSSVLHKNGMLPASVFIQSFKGEKLDGGYHSKVRKFEVEYSTTSPSSPPPARPLNGHSPKPKPNPPDENEAVVMKRLPKTYVVKILSWKTSVWERLIIALRKQGGRMLANRETLYLDSYLNEARFYSLLTPYVQGIKIPKVYYHFEDCFNNKFGFVLQDAQLPADPLSSPPLPPPPSKKKNGHSDGKPASLNPPPERHPSPMAIDGQPYGFTESETINLITQLARFHAPFWNSKLLDSYKAMENGGYWTGAKLMKEKLNVLTDWATAVSFYSPHLSISPSAQSSLGRRLHDNLHLIQSHCSLMAPLTFLHGDYKISNLFLNPLETESFHHSSLYGVYAIDWQWIGKGAGVNDVAYYLCTSTTPEGFSIPFFKKIVRVYTETLKQLGIVDYEFDLAWKHFKLAVIDFFLFCVVSKYSKMKVEEIYHYQEKRKDGLHLRSLFHIERFIEITETFMNDLQYN